MRSFGNIPRKKVKFQNWMKNSLKVTDSNLQDQVWDIFSETTGDVIAQYYAVAGEHHKSEEDILVTFNKKVNNNPKFKVLKDKVKLVK
ncbi:UNVERIFIED_CONTAM: hypothetical protein H355_014449 [Colinus virginianus]|nr:hypothetical protein H355_014449 [Colinus virginianus]